jgi:hypothetical protein
MKYMMRKIPSKDEQFWNAVQVLAILRVCQVMML